MQAESGIVPDFEVGEEFHEEPKTYYELKSQPLKSRWDRRHPAPPGGGRGAPALRGRAGAAGPRAESGRSRALRAPPPSPSPSPAPRGGFPPGGAAI